MRLVAIEQERIPDMAALWNNNLSAFPMRQSLLRQNSFDDENICYQASRLAVDQENQVIGMLIAKRWQEDLDVAMPKEAGWIQVLLVDQQYRRQGIGRQLLQHAENTFCSIGIQQIVLGRDPYHYFPGIPAEDSESCLWFEKQGYLNQGEDYDLLHSYEESPPEITSFEKERGDVSFQTLQLAGKEAFLAFLHRCFPGRWEYEAMHYFQKGGKGREFIVLKKADKIIGFCRINDAHSPYIAQNVYWAPLFEQELGGIGPLGVDAEERGQGLGLAIVEAGIHILRERGIRHIVIDWTGLVTFYQKLGYQPWKKYISYKKEY
ncbi:GNAT family N-acetyltransferase [Gracilibacillus alcaliphilus]|uniref:GNAT family N-acetyltransferase n=1 Tax=Gracilibacillus alcaliphilus TaxID=1401441 RepID=UPI00195861F2|nr:GNAT family N-acetyltransferase [Gracilibacillus alcaliphilus]MBM7676993.1 putative N-acetyltransferase YhbS [Gracilibacillus alcaliphilus]